MLKEFQEFMQRGNVIDLAVAVVIGAGFSAIVNSLVNDIIMPLIGLIIGGIDFSGLAFQVGEAVFAYGNFIQAVINFMLIAFAMFLIVRTYNRLRSQEEETPETPPEPSDEVKLLEDIRNILREK